MKKGWKIFWIVCGSLFGLGIILCVAGFALGATWEAVQGEVPDWISFGKEVSYNVEKEYEYGETVDEAENVTSFQNVNKIEVEAEIMNLEVLTDESLDNEVRVEVSDNIFATKINLYQENETLVIETNKKLSLGDDAGTIWIYIPDARFGEVELDVDAGSVYIENIISGSLNVSIGAGEAVIERFVADDVDFECGAGRIDAAGDCGREMDTSCGTGEINLALTGTKEDYNYEVECGIGEVVVGEDTYSGIGSKEHHSHGAAKEMSIECGIGSIDVTFDN